jgi:ankyrin repeat protein
MVLLKKRWLKDNTNLSTLDAKPGQIFTMVGAPSAGGAVPKKVRFMEEGDMGLHEASERGDEDTVQRLLENGADVNAKGEDGDTPLCRAASHGREGVVGLLLRNGADIKAKDWCGYTPLCWAACNGYKRVVELLLENGADVNAGDFGTALHGAASNGHAEVARLLLEKGIDIKARDEEGKTALDRATGKLCDARAILGQEYSHTKGLKEVVRVLRKARDNVEGRRG